MKKVLLPVSFSLLILLFSCRKNTDTNIGDLHLTQLFNADGQTLFFDSVKYTHPAGYLMSFSRVQFYLSDFVFHRTNGEKVGKSDILYFDARKSETFDHILKDLPVGDYSGFECKIGIDSAHNKTGVLGVGTDNLNMEWPDAMGGGYHFIKLEGNYKDGGGTTGYAMHLGTNKYIVQTGIVHRDFTIPAGKSTNIIIRMNLMEWFKNPAVFDFDKEGNFIMGNEDAMDKFRLNGSDVLND